MIYNLSQKDISILSQGIKELYSRVELLNRNKKILVQIEGDLISDSLTIDAESDVRRSYSCELKYSKANWNRVDKFKYMTYYLSPYIGIRHIRTKEIIWYKLGTYAFNSINFSYDEYNSKLNIQCMDLMCTLNGTLDGELKDKKLIFEKGSNIRSAIIDTLFDIGINNYNVCEIDKTIPYDKEYSSTTYYDVLKDLIDIYPGYEIYFDLDGLLIIDKIPTCQYDENILDDSIIQPLLISQSGNRSFENIYNHIVVYGMNIETDRKIENCTYSNNIYYSYVDNLNSYENFETYSINIPNTNLSSAKLTINNVGAKNIVIDDGVLIGQGVLLSGLYSFRYRRATDDFLLLGKYQVKGEAWDENPDSPFNYVNLGYELYHECSGSDYEKIYTDELANQRARYEIWKATNIQNSLSLELMSIPWLDVNTKISYTDKENQETNDYIIKRINVSFINSTMTMDIIKFYEQYPYIVDIIDYERL